MRKSTSLLLSALLGALLGFAAAALWLDHDVTPVTGSSTPTVLRAPAGSEEEASAARPVVPTPGPSEEGSERGEKDARARSVDGPAKDEAGAWAGQMRELRARELAARNELVEARRRIAQLEQQLTERETGELVRPERARHEFDLAPEDWREMAARGMLKYRLPLEAPPPTDEVLELLGLAPDDRDVLRQALENSASRLRSAVLPLCSAALGGRLEPAREMTTEACARVVFSTASERSESQAASAKSVASFMAGDAPRPGEEASLSERLFLVLAEEASHIEDELAEAFGPEEEHRLMFSDPLCFRTSTHRFSAMTERWRP